MLERILPFLGWFGGYDWARFRADLVAGITVALVLVPQCMAYAQLAGLPAYYGLYASFLPPLVAALFGSSRQLATGPVAVVSMMTAATLEPLATAGSEAYIAYAIVLALAVGFFQLALGVLRLGLVVNFLSHPVVNGFTNAAALIIATSQLSKIFGVQVDKAEHHYETIARVLESAWQFTHWATLLLALLAFGLMYGLKRLNPRMPYVLVAVAVTTVISWATGYEHNEVVPISDIMERDIRAELASLDEELARLGRLGAERAEHVRKLARIVEENGEQAAVSIHAESELAVLNLRIRAAEREASVVRSKVRAHVFEGVPGEDGHLRFYPVGEVPPSISTDGRRWRALVGNRRGDGKHVTMCGGGAVVGSIPPGLPALAFPTFEWTTLSKLFGAAVIISILGFMEAISIAKAISARTGQRLDPNRELIGQGLANIVGAFGKSYPVSGSFSRSAVNFQAGAVTGLSSVVTSLMVVLVLLFFTPLLYHLPQSVLAAVIMMAVFGLLSVSSFVHAYRAKRLDGVISVISFVATLGFAPHLDRGILIGVLLSVGLFLYEYMHPRVTFLARHEDGSFRDAERWGLARCDHILAVRFYGKLFFANTAALESRVLEAMAEMPELRCVIIVGNGISDVDASGEEILDKLVDEIRDRGLDLCFSGMRTPVLDVMKRTRLYEKIGEQNFFPNLASASALHCDLTAIALGDHDCPLQKVIRLEDAKPEARS